jgi:predicted acylesterase/phospholipase RssA
MEGGGDKGAWQVGALKSIIKRYPDGYDVLSGVSVGALNGGFMSMYTKEQEAQAIIDLEKLWLSLNSDSVYNHPYLLRDAYRIFFSRFYFLLGINFLGVCLIIPL